MIGIRNRGALPKVVQDEFENFAARIRAFFLKEHNEDGTHLTTPSSLSFIPVGFEGVWPTDTAPPGWLFARGQQVSRVKYNAYFNLIGTSYGAGDGSLTFNVPNAQGRTVYGKAVSGTGSTLAGTFGSMDHVHTGPSHDHSITGSTGSVADHNHDVSGVTDGPNLLVEVQAGTGTNVARSTHAHGFSDTTTSDGGHSHSAGSLDTSNAGTGNTGTSNPPGIAQNWIIYVGVAD